MKKRILLLFVAMIGMATSVGWAQGDGDTTASKQPTGVLTQKTIGGQPCIFANGHAVTVTETPNNSEQITITVDGTEESLTVAATSNLYGGSYGMTVANSTIKMVSGIIANIHGGGYGIDAGQTGDVTGTASVTIEGGKVTNLLVGGGNQYAKTGKVAIKVIGKDTEIKNLYAGGIGSPAAKNQVKTWEEAVCGAKEVEINIADATLKQGLGCGGGNGYTYTGTSTVTIQNAILGSFYGTLANGYADDITATLTECTFKKLVDWYEFATINRGAVNNASFTLDGCTFENLEDINAGVGPILGWDNSDTSGDPKPVVDGSVSWTFTNTKGETPVMHLGPGLSQADVEVVGAKTKLIQFTQKTSGTVTAFSIEQGKKWTLGKGLSIEEGVTFTNKGTLNMVAPDVASLTTGIKADAHEIHLVSGTTYTLTDPLVINKPIILTSDGAAKATIKGNLVVEAENVSINNLAFECNSTGTNYWKKNAITLFGNTITVDGCTFKGSAADNQYVANGIVIFPTAADNASYAITGNTFTNFNQEVGSGSDYWTSTALLLCDNTSITKKGASEATSIPALTSWNETSLADASNTFTNCFADYIHQTGTSYVYDVTSTAKAVADGINSIEKGKTGTIVATSLTNEAILTAIKELKPSLEGQFIVKSQEGSIVADPNLVSTGTVFVLSKSGEEYTIKQQTVAPKVDFSSLKASVIEAGQPLSASILSGGSANVAGVFSWKEPATIVEKGAKKTFDVIFTPTDLIGYNVVGSTYTFDEIKQYYTVQTGKCANGHLEIASANTSNKYEEGSTLTVKPVADAHFAFDQYLNETGFAGNTYTVSANATLTAEFKPIMRTVTISVTGTGSVNVNGESKNNSSTVSVQEGSVLTIQAVPGEGQVLSSLTAGGSAFNSNTVTIDKDLTIAATFASKPAETYVVKVSAVPNGKINLYDANGNAIASGSSFKADETISVVAVPDLGYKLKDNSLKYNSNVVANNQITVAKADAAITAEFTKQSFAVSTDVKNGTITLAQVNNKEQKVNENSSSYEYGTELTATAEAASGYKLLSLVVNGKEIPNEGSFIVTAKTTVTAVMAKLATITIDKTPQSFTYDGTAKEFVVKTTPAGIGGFTVKYDNSDTKPVNAAAHADKAYTVTIKRAADDTYAAVNESAQLIIKPAQMKGVAIPTLNNEENGVATATDKGTYALVGSVDGTTHLGSATFTPTDVNYAIMTFTVAGKSAVPCSYTPQLQSAKLTTRSGDASSLNITVTGNGSVKVLNGGVEATNLYVGQTITIQAVPASTEYAANATWNDGSVSNTKKITLASGTNNITVAFQKKTSPTPTLTIPTDMVYNGTPFAGKTISVDGAVKDWDLSFEGIPTDAGTYKIYASRKADENYKAVVNKEVGSFTIGQAVADASNPVATEILQGQALAQSVITGTANVDGTFEWVNPNTILNADATGEAVRFVPTSKNYSVKDGLTADVKVTETGVTIRTLNLTVVGEEFGAVSMTLDGNPATAGATVTKGQELKVTATAKTGYEASVQIDGSARTTYTIGETGNVEVKVTFTKKSEPSTPTDPDPEPEVTDVTGVSLDATAKTLAVGESFALKATVKPADADNKKVSWSSSDATIASVDKDGNVKALKAGTCKITVTTEDGDYTATCDITVTIATGIDELLAANRIYTDYGQIIVEPTTSLEVLITDMTGRIVYHDRITEKITVPVSGGIYIVRLVESKRVATTKVIVK